MKKRLILSIVVLAAGSAQIINAQSLCNQTNQALLAQVSGTVVAGSYDYDKIPEKAKTFISENFKGINVMRVEKESDSNTYEVTMQNGVEVEFTYNGEVKEIDGHYSPLSANLVKVILPSAAYDTLTAKTLHENVREIDVEGYKGYYEVKFVRGSSTKEIKFDLKGNILKIK